MITVCRSRSAIEDQPNMEARRRQVFDALTLFHAPISSSQLAQHLKIQAHDVLESLGCLTHEKDCGISRHRDFPSPRNA